MPKRILIVVILLIAVFATTIVADNAYSESIPVNWRVAGTVVPIPIPGAAPDAQSAIMIQAFVKGAPGKAQFTVISTPSDFNPNHPECGGGPGQNFSPNDMVITFEDLSMIFAKLDDTQGGWVCFGLDGLTAVANMVVDGGTGKYEGASGYFKGEFEGNQVGDSGLLSAETGTIVGHIDR